MQMLNDANILRWYELYKWKYLNQSMSESLAVSYINCVLVLLLFKAGSIFKTILCGAGNHKVTSRPWLLKALSEQLQQKNLFKVCLRSFNAYLASITLKTGWITYNFQFTLYSLYIRYLLYI